jgi:hypothetical protein
VNAISLDLSIKLRNFNSTLTEAEKANFKLLLGLSAGGLVPNFERPKFDAPRMALDAVTETLAKLQPYSNRISKNGIAFRGRPKFLTDNLLKSLQVEAESIRPRTVRFDEHYLGCGAPIANKLATSFELVEFVKANVGFVEPTGVASFIFYDEVGQGIDPHIDTDIFSLNVLLMLSHKVPEKIAARSTLVVFPPDAEPESFDLEPGEVVIMFAGSIAHGRQRVTKDESVSILTFGFHPLGE